MAILRKLWFVLKCVGLLLAINFVLVSDEPTDVSIVEGSVNFVKSESAREEAKPFLSYVDQKLHELEEIYVDRVQAFGVLADTTRRCEIDWFKSLIEPFATPEALNASLRHAIGAIQMPPKWVLDYQQCTETSSTEAAARVWEVEELSRFASNRRFRMLPRFYTVFHKLRTTGVPVMITVFFADPTDTFLLGPILIKGCPSPTKRTANVDIVLPKGIWQRIHVNDDHPELHFLKGSSTVPTRLVVQHVDEASPTDTTVTLLTALGDQASRLFYEDDGEDFRCQSGNYVRTHHEAEKVSSSSAKDGNDATCVSTARGQRHLAVLIGKYVQELIEFNKNYWPFLGAEGTINVSRELLQLDDREVEQIIGRMIDTEMEISLHSPLLQRLLNFMNLVHSFIRIDIDKYPGTRIKAEKEYEEKGDAGILIILETKAPAELEKIRFEVTIRGRPGIIKELLEDLQDQDPVYKLMTDNCWDYAQRRFRALMQRAIENAVDQEERDYLERKITELISVERRMPLYLVLLIIKVIFVIVVILVIDAILSLVTERERNT